MARNELHTKGEGAPCIRIVVKLLSSYIGLHTGISALVTFMPFLLFSYIPYPLEGVEVVLSNNLNKRPDFAFSQTRNSSEDAADGADQVYTWIDH